ALRRWYDPAIRMPILSSIAVMLKMPEISGVISSPWLYEVSSTPLAAMLPRRPGRSSGRGVLRLIDEPIPPDATDARPVLYTSTPAMPSDARLAKSNERDEGGLAPSPSVEVGIWRP